MRDDLNTNILLLVKIISENQTLYKIPTYMSHNYVLKVIYRVCLDFNYRLWKLVVAIKMIKFCLRKNTASPLRTKYHHITCSVLPFLLLTVRCFYSGTNLTPLDYFLWDHTKILIYETPVESEEDLLARVMAAADVGLSGIGSRVYQHMVRRYRECVEVAGRHIEIIL